MQTLIEISNLSVNMSNLQENTANINGSTRAVQIPIQEIIESQEIPRGSIKTPSGFGGQVGPTGAEVIHLKYSNIIQNQATLNLITGGSVSHGKSTLVRALTGVKTQKFQKELERNCTIHLGYANGKIFRCPKTGYQCVTGSQVTERKHPVTGDDLVLIKHFSVVDAPGHEALMSTMISGTQNVQLGFLVIAANDPVFPEPQTYEHLLALSVPQVETEMGKGLEKFLVLQNKLDLVTEAEARTNQKKIREFLSGSPADCEITPMIPISAQLKYNIDVVSDYLFSEGKEPVKNYNLPARLMVIRSFDVNKGDRPISQLAGGIAGGSLRCGVLRTGDWVEIRPGMTYKNSGGKWISRPLISKVKSIQSEKTKMDLAISGGLLGIGLDLDPGFTKNNALVGQVLGHLGTLPGVYNKVLINYHTLNRMRDKLGKLAQGEKLQACINSKVILAMVVEVIKEDKNSDDKKKKKSKTSYWIQLANPVSFETSDRISFLRQSEGKWSLDGYGSILDMKPVEVELPPEYEQWRDEQQARQVKIEIEYDLPEMTGMKKGLDFFDWDTLAEKIHFKGGGLTEGDGVASGLPRPQVSPFNRKSIFTNFHKCAQAVDFRPNIWAGLNDSQSLDQSRDVGKPNEIPQDSEAVQAIFNELNIGLNNLIDVQPHLFNFLSSELATSCSLNESQQMLISGRFGSSQVQRVFTNYAHKFVFCQNQGCTGQKTFMYKKNRLGFQYCYSCHSSHSIRL